MENEGTHPISRADVRIEKVLKNIRHEVELYHSEYEGKHRTRHQVITNIQNFLDEIKELKEEKC